MPCPEPTALRAPPESGRFLASGPVCATSLGHGSSAAKPILKASPDHERLADVFCLRGSRGPGGHGIFRGAGSVLRRAPDEALSRRHRRLQDLPAFLPPAFREP